MDTTRILLPAPHACHYVFDALVFGANVLAQSTVPVVTHSVNQYRAKATIPADNGVNTRDKLALPGGGGELPGGVDE
jgi:hypothetical protein